MTKKKEAIPETTAKNSKRVSSAKREVKGTNEWWKHGEGFAIMYDNEYDNEFI